MWPGSIDNKNIGKDMGSFLSDKPRTKTRFSIVFYLFYYHVINTIIYKDFSNWMKDMLLEHVNLWA